MQYLKKNLKRLIINAYEYKADKGRHFGFSKGEGVENPLATCWDDLFMLPAKILWGLRRKTLSQLVETIFLCFPPKFRGARRKTLVKHEEMIFFASGLKSRGAVALPCLPQITFLKRSYNGLLTFLLSFNAESRLSQFTRTMTIMPQERFQLVTRPRV